MRQQWKTIDDDKPHATSFETASDGGPSPQGLSADNKSARAIATTEFRNILL